jgi:hypothetical protein
MPTYTFEDTNTGTVFDKIMKISERDLYLKENPNITQRIGRPPAIGDSVRLGLKKPDAGFRDVLSNVKKHHPSSIKKDGAQNKINTW